MFVCRMASINIMIKIIICILIIVGIAESSDSVARRSPLFLPTNLSGLNTRTALRDRRKFNYMEMPAACVM